MPILKFDPAVMVLGVELPRMNGIEFLRKLMPQYPVATIVFGETAGYEQDARAAGAVDFLKKTLKYRFASDRTVYYKRACC